MQHPRSRVGSSADQKKPANVIAHELQLHASVDVLAEGLDTLAAPLSPEALEKFSDNLCQVRRLLVDSPSARHAKDEFRRRHGFETLFKILRAFKDVFAVYDSSSDVVRTVFEVLKCIFDVLSEALVDHVGNNNYFSHLLEDGGWNTLGQLILAMGFTSEALAKSNENLETVVRCSGLLFSLALREETLSNSFRTAVSGCPIQLDKNPEHREMRTGKHASDRSGSQGANDIASQIEQVERFVDKLVTNTETVYFPEAFDILLTIWLNISVASGIEQPYLQFSLILLLLLAKICHSSEYNAVLLSRSHIMSKVIGAFDDSSIPKGVYIALQRLFHVLVKLGIEDLNDVSRLYKLANQSLSGLDLLLTAVKQSQGPPHFQFDLSLLGHAAVEFSALRGSFPPSGSNSSYTFICWLRIDEFDKACHTTIFGAFDQSNTCFTLLYVEKDTHQLVLQTSVKSTSNKPSARFKAFTFKKSHWYHIAVIHTKSQSEGADRARLVVDGQYVDQVKISFPNPPQDRATKGLAATISGNSKAEGQVQAFIGTPQDLSPRHGRGMLKSRFSLASAHLFARAIEDELILVYEKLGPQYHGNYQDCLGSFQTYTASAFLNIYNEQASALEDDNSIISRAIRSKASDCNSEANILLGISTFSIYQQDWRRNSVPLQGKLSAESRRLFERHTQRGANDIAFNTASPSMTNALRNDFGVGTITGGTVLYRPVSLDSASWRLGACVSLVTRLLDDATTLESVTRALSLFFEMVVNSWRNCEAMERDSGYGVLAWLIRKKITTLESNGRVSSKTLDNRGHSSGSITRPLLEVILKFMGYNSTQPEDALIINPFAYRVLLVDTDIWQTADCSTQNLYYEQFVIFSQTSRFRDFNNKRLSRMRIVKKMIESFKNLTVDRDALAGAKRALMAVMQSTLSSDALRSIAVYIVYACHVDEETAQASLPSETSSASLRLPNRGRFSTSSRSRSPSILPLRASGVSSQELGLATLETMTELLCTDDSNVAIRKFAKSVTNKWLIHLLSESNPRIITCAAKIWAKLLVIHGTSYVAKFEEKTHGFSVLCQNVQHHWNSQALWLSCLAILFGIDISKIDCESSVDAENFLKILLEAERTQVWCSSIMVIMNAMIEGCINDIAAMARAGKTQNGSSHQFRPIDQSRMYRDSTVPVIFSIFTLLHRELQSFRDFMVASTMIRDLIKALYRAEGKIVDDEIVQDESKHGTHEATVARKQVSASPSNEELSSKETTRHSGQRYLPRRRGSSFVMVPRGAISKCQSLEIIMPLRPSKLENNEYLPMHPITEDLVKILSLVFLDQILNRKEFVGLGLFLKAPSSTAEDRALLNSYLFKVALARLRSQLQDQPEAFWQPMSLSSVSRFTLQCAEALFEGWFVDGSWPLIEFSGALLEYLHSPAVKSIKSVRWSTPALLSIQSVFRRSALFRLSTSLTSQLDDQAYVQMFEKLLKWNSFLLLPEGDDDLLIEALCYIMFLHVSSMKDAPQRSAMELLQDIVKARHFEILNLLTEASDQRLHDIGTEFVSIILRQDGLVHSWITEHAKDLREVFSGAPAAAFAQFCADENLASQKSSNMRIQKRKERVEQWHLEDVTRHHIWTEHDIATRHWVNNIHSWEALKHSRSRQDQQDSHKHSSSKFQKFKRALERLQVFEENTESYKWQLDDVEGPDRVRKRLAPFRSVLQDYRPKGSVSKEPKKPPVTTQLDGNLNVLATVPLTTSPTNNMTFDEEATETKLSQQMQQNTRSQIAADLRDEEFELVSKPDGEDEEFDDKNRKVMRSLQRGEQVRAVCNVCRIRGLEASESLLIQGKYSLYLLDNLFQRADGEILESSQAPKDEKDPYMQGITGTDTTIHGRGRGSVEIESQHWSWPEIISISKRHFLFRDVALEIFFNDGRSLLLTTISKISRDSLYSTLTDRAITLKNPSSSIFDESYWRIELLRNPRDATQTLGTKFANVFSHSTLPATKQWLRGEMSNFHYLMVINTMAGRTFNDLTQYPIFPWVLADYQSDKLDLSNPFTFRDLSKPMGCQTLEREAAFRERYNTYAEMADENAPPFHYGTHYSSAMIVSSYLIRLEPFVQSYLLLQGGTFDHAERLFHSIEGAWLSASRETMTDVRELTPEFFYLPEFLVNSNRYDFGSKSSTGEAINDVKLPPWAKGDPAIFIAKHREALESPYVTRNLHNWIDLVFGFKQRGEAAIEAMNVFHYLSYHGAKDLDSIEDELERDATIGIIHNFGQTPRQLFKRAHERNETLPTKSKDPVSYIQSLRRVPSTLFDIAEPIAGLWIAPKQHKLLCAGPFKTFLPPFYNLAVEWGNTDGSVRFYASQNRKAIFEQLHQDEISAAQFADSSTLITASKDCTVGVWSVNVSGNSFSVQVQSCLCGHRAPVVAIFASRKFSSLLSASSDGHVILWDLNRLEPVREFFDMRQINDMQIHDHDGNIILCHGQRVTLFTLNGQKLLEQSLCDEENDKIYSCEFYQPGPGELLDAQLIFTGHKHGIVKVWKLIITDHGNWRLNFICHIEHFERSRGEGFRYNSAITCILSADQNLYTGDEDGRVFQWEYVR